MAAADAAAAAAVVREEERTDRLGTEILPLLAAAVAVAGGRWLWSVRNFRLSWESYIGGRKTKGNFHQKSEYFRSGALAKVILVSFSVCHSFAMAMKGGGLPIFVCYL